jgi:predicted permease
MRNIVLAVRALARNPFVTTVAALSLGLGIGSNAAIYAIFHTMLRQEVRVSDPERLVNFSAPGPKPGSNSCGPAGDCEDVFSYPMFRDLQAARPASLAAMVGHRDFSANVNYERNISSERGLLVSGNYFSTLGVRPAIGRLLTPADDATPGAHPLVVLSHRYWTIRLGGDSTVVGRTLTVNGLPQTIIGVAPRGFDGTTYGMRPSFFAPLAMAGTVGTGTVRRIEDRRTYWIYAFGRLAPGATIPEVRNGINRAYAPIISDVEAPLQTGMRDSVLARFRAKQVLVSDGRRGQSDFAGGASTPLFMLFAITGLVLLIACANIANLLMARATNREMEMAMRLSLGGTRRRLLMQLLTESVTLAAAGGLASLLFATWTLRGIIALLPAEVSEPLGLGMNWEAVAFAAVLSLATGILFGLFPALHSTRPDLVTALHNNSGRLSGGRTASRFRTSLATVQIALAMALLMGSGLFLKSLWKVNRVELGVRVERLMRFSLSPEASGYDSTRTRTLFDRVEQELAALPGATGVTTAMVPLIAGSNWNNTVKVQGFQTTDNADAQASFNGVGPGFFRTTGVPVLAGREFTAEDDMTRPRVAIVNETFARKFGLGTSPVGKRMASRGGDTVSLDIEIVGLVRDTKYSNVKGEIPPVYFTPHRQVRRVGEMNFYVRTDGDPALMLRALRNVVERVDPMLPVENLKTMPEEIREQPPRIACSVRSWQRSRRWRRCWRRLASTACWRILWRSERARSGCGWRWAPAPRRSGGWSFARWR